MDQPMDIEGWRGWRGIVLMREKFPYLTTGLPLVKCPN
jgi:hypothetical protein